MSGAYTHEINVTWGDCDPAQIAYTARIPAFALDAINGFWEHHLDGDGWFQMELDRGFGTPFVHMTLDFTSPITPRHKLLCEVKPLKLGNRSIEFQVIGRQNDIDCFKGRFVCVFTVAGSMTTRPAPEEIRAVIEPLIPQLETA